MKKNLFKLLTLLLALCLVLCACGEVRSSKDDDDEEEESETTAATAPETTAAPTVPETTLAPLPADEELILGTWKADMECGGLYNMMMEATLGEEIAAYIDFTGLTLPVYYTFEADGFYTTTIEEEDMQIFATEAATILRNSMRTLLEDMLADQLNGKTLDELLAEQNTTFDQLLKDAGLDVETLANSMLEAMEGTETTAEYSLENGMLILADAEQPYTLDLNTLTVYAPEGLTTEEEIEMAESMYPMVMIRIN